jgi:hypothetical protein
MKQIDRFLSFYVMLFIIILILSQPQFNKGSDIVPPSYEESLEKPPPYTPNEGVRINPFPRRKTVTCLNIISKPKLYNDKERRK